MHGFNQLEILLIDDLLDDWTIKKKMEELINLIFTFNFQSIFINQLANLYF